MSVATAVPDQHFWIRHSGGWHALTVVVCVFDAVLIAMDTSLASAPRLSAVGLLLLTLLWYVVTGAGRLTDRDERRGLVYLAGLVVLFTPLAAITLTASFLMLTINAQLFMMFARWQLRTAALVVFYGIVAAATLYHVGVNADGVGVLGMSVLVPLAVAVVFGGYVTGIIRQSQTRAGLIQQLTEAREALARERHTAGALAERARLSAEIHDTLAQGFTGILMLTQSARVVHTRDPAQIPAQLDLIERTARENLAEARSLVAALSPPDLAGRSLAEALARLAARHTRDTGASVAVDVDGDGEDCAASSAPEIDAVLLRAAQEALSNVRRHANASTVRITLSRNTIEVTDDGRGFDPDTDTGGYGLRGLRRRMEDFGGSCTVVSTPGAGTSVRVELPHDGVEHGVVTA